MKKFDIYDLTEQVEISGKHSRGKTDLDVKELEFKSSDLSHIPNEFFVKFESLKKVDARETGLKILELKNCANLEELSVGNNELVELPKSLSNSPKLNMVNAAENLITELELNSCDSLRKIYLQNNRLTRLTSSSLGACKNLEVIDLRHNQIFFFEPGFLLNFDRLKDFNLNHNKLRQLLDGALHTSSVNLSINIEDNPLNKIEGSFNDSAVLKKIKISMEDSYPQIDPKFLNGFTGKIDSLQIYGNCRVQMRVPTSMVDYVRKRLKSCFDNFESFKPTTTSRPHE